MSEAILTSIFLEQVPLNLHDILVASAHTDLVSLASIADKIMEFRAPHFRAAISQSSVATPATGTKSDKPREEE